MLCTSCGVRATVSALHLYLNRNTIFGKQLSLSFLQPQAPHSSTPHFDSCPLDFFIPAPIYLDLAPGCQAGSDAYDVSTCCGHVRLAFLKVLEANAAILPPDISSRALADACGAGFKEHLTGLYQ